MHKINGICQHETTDAPFNSESRYIITFDKDVSMLPPAYAPHATVSLRMVTSTNPSVGKIRQGREEIAAALNCLRTYKFCPAGVLPTVCLSYDVVALHAAAGGGILLSIYGEVVDMALLAGGGKCVYSIDQAFVLKRMPEAETGKDEGWPFVAVSHQMALREIDQPPLEIGSLEEEFPWLV